MSRAKFPLPTKFPLPLHTFYMSFGACYCLELVIRFVSSDRSMVLINATTVCHFPPSSLSFPHKHSLLISFTRLMSSLWNPTAFVSLPFLFSLDPKIELCQPSKWASEGRQQCNVVITHCIKPPSRLTLRRSSRADSKTALDCDVMSHAEKEICDNSGAKKDFEFIFFC